MRQISIGRQFQSAPAALWAAAIVASAVTCADFALAWRGVDTLGAMSRLCVALAGLTMLLVVARGDRASLGLLRDPEQGWSYWGKATLVIAVLFGACLAAGLGLWKVFSGDLPIYHRPPDEAGAAFLWMCVISPIVEELVYRLTLCAPLAAAVGPKAAIVLSGVAFGMLHVVYGNPSPDNLVAGFFLAWAYFKSGTIVVPIALHSLGNLCALAAQIAAYGWLFGWG